MNDKMGKNALFKSSHMMILVCYTIFAVLLAGESILLGWELWAVLLIIIGVVVSWFIHIQQKVDAKQRLWIYSILIMGSFFFYGIHETSAFDIAAVMGVLMMIYTMTAIKPLITLCQVTYFVTLSYSLVNLYKSGEVFDRLIITRSLLHIALILTAGLVARTIIDKWDEDVLNSQDQIVMLKDATNRLNDFLANVSHEIRTPINAVVGLAGVCYEKVDNEEVRADLASIQEAGRRVAEQISDILDYSEIDSHRLTNNTENYMLSSVLHDLVTQMRPYKRDDIELVIDVAPSVPSMMNTDVGKLKKVLWHLMMNGIKYTKEGGVYVRIYSVEKDYGINLCIEVKDTGIGMSPEEAERITEGFYQANSGRDRSSSGLGLGMAIVKGFVASLGGFMSVESTLGKGTCVRVSLPQQVIDPSGCMSLKNKEKLCIGAFLQFEKYSVPEVREFYNLMVRNIVVGLGVQMHWAANVENLKKLGSSIEMTHLFVAEEEYDMAPEYIEELAERMIVTVVANKSYSLPKNSKARIMEKPFYCFPVANVLNMNFEEMHREEKRMRMPDVTVLVVDDEVMNLTVAKGIFKQYRMKVETARSGQESIDKVGKNDYDIVFMDHMMPGMDGVEAMKRIRELKRDIPIVALTANAVSTAREMFIREGFDGFVSKPIELVDLERVMKGVLPASKIIYERVKKDTVTEPTDEIEIVKAPEPVKETAEEQISAEDEYFALRKAGINPKVGLHYCQDDPEFYDELLKQYLSDAPNKKENLKEKYEGKDFPNYTIFVHALKSTSKMIGQESLSEKAAELEAFGKAGGEQITDEAHKKMMDEYETVTEGISAYLSFKGMSVSDEPEDEDDDILEFSPEGE